MALEEDLPEFRGGSLRIIVDHRHNDSPKHVSVEKEASVDSNTQNCHWKNAFMAPLSSIPNKSKYILLLLISSIWLPCTFQITYQRGIPYVHYY